MKVKPKCACGCGRRVKGARATYLKGHGTTADFPCTCKLCGDEFSGSRRDANRCQKCLHNPDKRKCACGCGKLTRSTYVSGHNLRSGLDFECDRCGKDFVAKSGTAQWCPDCLEPKRCKCGCEKLTTSGFREYLSGHNPPTYTKRKCVRCGGQFSSLRNSTKQCSDCTKPKPCKCGCGEMVTTTSQGSEYVRGHHPFYTSDEHRKMRSLNCKAQLGRQSSAERLLQEHLDGRTFKYTGLDNARGRGKYGQPVSADFTVPRLKLIIQVDGCYWHGCKKHGQKGTVAKKQRRRDRELNRITASAGWKMLRVWEHDIKYNIEEVLLRIKSWVSHA